MWDLPPGLIQQVRPARLFEGVASQLYTLLSKGRLQGGDRLPSEKQLGEMFNVSRTSVREALRSLGALGIVEVRNGAGAYVKKTSPEAVGSILSMVLFHDVNDIPRIYEARRFLEGWTGYYAAERATPEEIAGLEEVVESQSGAVALGESGVEDDFQFHLLLAKAARNEVVTRMLHSMITLIFKVLDPARRPTRDLTVAVEQHRRILDAVRRHDGAGAMREMWEHISIGPETDHPFPAFFASVGPATAGKPAAGTGRKSGAGRKSRCGD